MSERLNDHIRMLEQVAARLQKAQPASSGMISDEILQQLERVIDLLKEHSDAAYPQGIDWICQLITHQPQLGPVLERDLLWFFGGECLHYLSDDEISLFQQLDELEEAAQAAGEPFNRQQTRQTLSASGYKA